MVDLPSLEHLWLYREAVRCVVRRGLGDAANFSARHVDAKIWSFLRSAVHVPRDFPTIAAALQAAPMWPPCTILVAAGVYKEKLVLDRPVCLVGLRSAKPPMVEHPDDQDAQSSSLVKVVSANPAAVPQLQNLEFRGCVWVADGAGASIRGCSFTAPANVGVYVSQSASVLVQESKFLRNAGGGILLRDTCRAKIEGCVFEGNGSHGVHVSHGAVAVIKANEFKETAGPAVLLRSSEKIEEVDDHICVVEGNTIESSQGSGIQLCGQSEARLTANVLKRHKMAAIAIQASGSGTVSRNLLEDNYGLGIWVGGSATTSLEQNHIKDNQKVRVIEFSDSTGAAVRARVVCHRDDPQHQLTHQLEYIQGDKRGEKEWVGMDEQKELLSNQAGRSGVGFKTMPPLTARSVHDGEGGNLHGVSSTRGVKRSAIAITESADVVVRGNHLENNDAIGIYLGGTSKGLVEQNILRGHKYSAILAEDSATFTLRGNSIGGNRFDGIELRGDPSITDNGNYIEITSPGQQSASPHAKS